MHLVQWNVNGFHARREFIQLIQNKFSPAVFCLQETNFKNNHCASIRGYNKFFKNRTNTDHASGGVAIYVKENIPCEEIQIVSNLEAVAISISIPSKTTICNVYLPNSTTLELADLESLTRQLPKPFVIVGDFNSHNALWGSTRTDKRGRTVGKWLENTELVVLNENEHTHFNCSSGSLSSIDLSLCSANIACAIEWTVNEDLYNSDHFPIHINLNNNLSDSNVRNLNSSWNFNKADWSLFSEHVNSNLQDISSLDPQQKLSSEELLRYFESQIRSAADAAIPKRKSKNTKKDVPWWNKECEEAIKAYEHAYNVYKRHQTFENKIEFKKLRAKSRRIIKNSKKEAWRTFIRSLNRNTPSGEIWNALNRIEGKNRMSFTSVLTDDSGNSITDPFGMADLLADSFASNSSDNNYSAAFSKFKIETENETAASNRSDKCEDRYDDDPINSPFTEAELDIAISLCKNSSPGPDGIPIILVKNLPTNGRKFLLGMYNKIWTTETFPQSWRLATIVPIAKPGKDRTRPGNYRPISLTCNLCKLLEKMIDRRLKWYIESNNLLSPSQSGFRQFRSTMDHLVQMENYICKAFASDLHVVAVSMDIEKAYEMVWKQRVVEILKRNHLRGHIMSFIKNFLDHRMIEVRVRNCLSKKIPLQNGLPQGSVISVTLFLLAINDIMDAIETPVKGLLFADDLTLLCSGKNIETSQEIVQNTLNNLVAWSNKSGFKFSKTKTEFMVFTRGRSSNNISRITLLLDNTNLQRSHTLKILGLTFNTTLSWAPHVKILKSACRRRLDLIKTLSSKSWGADRNTLLTTYRAIIRAKLDYGSVIYGSASEHVLNQLNSIQTTAVRLAIGAFRSSPNSSVLAESYEPPISLRRIGMELSGPLEPTMEVLEELFENRPSLPRPLSLRRKHSTLELDFLMPEVSPRRIQPLPPWNTLRPTINFDMHLEMRKKITISENQIRNLFDELVETKFKNHKKCFTDGSILNENRGCAITLDDSILGFKLPQFFSIFSCEAYAILQALALIADCGILRTVIFSDSMSTLKAIENDTNSHPLIQDIQEKLHHLKISGKVVDLVWIPSHKGIQGNEAADTAAKAATTEALNCVEEIPISMHELKKGIRKIVFRKWNDVWTSSRLTKLHDVRESVWEPLPDFENRNDQSAVTRLRIGHTNMTHVYLCERSPAKQCDKCNTQLTIQHLIIECPKFSTQRTSMCLPRSLKECLSSEANAKKTLEFTKAINIYKLI